MMGIDEFLNFEKKLTALVKECGIDKYLKMRDERVAYGICQYLQNLWDIMHDRDEWHMFLARMEDPKPAETIAFARKYTVKDPLWRQDDDDYTEDEPESEAELSSIHQEPLPTSQDSKSGFVVEGEPLGRDEHLAQVEDELEQKFLDLEKRYVKLLGVVESLQAAKSVPEKDIPGLSLKENPVPAIQVLDQDPEEESFPPLMGFPEEDPEENAIPTFHYLDPAPEEESFPAINFTGLTTEEPTAQVINFADPAPMEESVSPIQFSDSVPEEESISTIQFSDPVPEEESISEIQFPDPAPIEESVSEIQFPDPTPFEESISAIQFPDPSPEESLASTAGFHEIPFNLETESAPETVPDPEPATGFSLETNSFNTSNVSNTSTTYSFQENCPRIGHPEAGFHISCFKCDKQKECQNSHDNNRSKR